MKELGSNALKNIISGFESCNIVPLNSEQVLKRIPRESPNNEGSWLSSFKNH